MAFADWKWALGVFLAALASIVSNLGINLQKLSHQNVENAPVDPNRNYLTDKTWALGLGLIIFGSVGDFLALGFAAQSIIAPLGSLTLVANVFFAPIMLGEKLETQDWIGTAAIVIGSALAVSFASHEGVSYTFVQLFGFYHTLRFAIYAALSGGACVFMYLTIQRLEAMQIDRSQAAEYETQRKFHRFLYGALSGIVGAQSVLFGKCTAEMIVATVSGHGLFFVYYQAYLIIGSMVASILLQIKWLNDGLIRFDSVSLIPIFQSFWILVSVVGGIVFFGEATQFSAVQAVMFPLGVIVTISGVYLLSRRSVAPRNDSIAEHINVDQLADDEDEDVVGGALGGPPGSRRSRGVSHAESVASLRTPMHTGLSSDDSHSLSIGSVTGGPSGATLIGSAPSYSLVGHNNEDDASESDGGSKPPHWWPQQPKPAGGSRPGSASGRGSAVDLPRKSSYSPPTTTDSSADEIIDFVNRGK